MAPSFGCRKCAMQFKSAGSRDTHSRSIHRKHCKINCTNGEFIVVEVSAHGKWGCPYPACEKACTRPDRLQQHYKTSHANSREDIAGGDATEVVYMQSPRAVPHSSVPLGVDNRSPISEEVPARLQADDAAPIPVDGTAAFVESTPNREHSMGALYPPRFVARFQYDSAASDVFKQATISVFNYDSLTLVSCMTCHVLLDGNNEEGKTVINHVKKHYGRSNATLGGGHPELQSDFMTTLSSALASIGFTPMATVRMFFSAQTEVVTPIPGLPIHEGLSCTLCNYHVVSEKAMANHKRHRHAQGDPFNPVPNFLQCLVEGVGKQYFAVQYSATQWRGNVVLKATIIKKFADFEQTLHSPGNPPAREVSAFLRSSRWIDCAEDLIPDGTVFLAVKGGMLLEARVDCPYSSLPGLMLSYGTLARRVGNEMDNQLRTSVRGRKKNTDGFHQFLMDSTLEKYCPVMTGFVLCLLRSACDSPYSFEHVVKAPTRLTEYLHALKTQLLDLGGRAIDPDDFDFTVLHRLLLSLWTPPRGPRVDARRSTDDVFVQYMILHTLKPRRDGGTSPSYAWGDVWEVAQMLSMLKHWCRTAVEMELARTLWDRSQDDGYTVDAAQELLAYVCEEVQLQGTPFSLVCNLQRLASTIAGRQEVLPHLTSDSKDHTYCSLMGYNITLHGFRDMVHGIHEDCKIILRQEVLFGLNTSWIDQLLEPGGPPIIDDLNNNEPGYSFLADARNPSFNLHKVDLCVHMFAGVVTTSHFVHGYNIDGTAMFNTKALSAWEAACEKVEDRLNLLLHFASGQPPRVSEYGSFLLRNTPTNHRSFFWSDGTLAIVQTYNKTARSSRKPKHVVRFLPTCMRPLFLQCLCLVRHAQMYVAGYLRGGSANALYRDSWFISYGRRRKSQQLSGSILREFSNRCGVPFRARDFRHVAIFFSEPIRRLCEELRKHDEIHDESSGHTVETAAEKYAQNSSDKRGIDRNRWKDFLYMSRKWQEDKLHLTIRHPHSARPSRPPGVQTVRPCADVEVDFYPPREGNVIRLSHNCDIGSSGDDKLDRIPASAMHMAKHALSKLGHAEWKTPEQAVAVTMAVDNVQDFFAILPTGSGKSVVFMAAAQSSAKTVVVVVPLMMLIKGHMAESRAYKIDCGHYKVPGDCSSSNPPPLVFVSAEIASTEHFLTWARLLLSDGKLHSVFIDEVHLVLSSFRPKMSQLFLLSGLQCQLVGLTASLRPEHESVLSTLLGRRVKVIRRSTVRPNLRYSVIDSKTIDLTIGTVIREWMAEAKAEDRVIVYCLSKGEVERLQVTLESNYAWPCSYLHARLAEGVKEAQLKKWEMGETNIMVATGVLGCGYNYPTVRLVIHKGCFYALHDYHQQSGRCSRDGQPGECVVVSNAGYRQGAANIRKKDGNPDDLDELGAANKWIENQNECRRQILHKVLDGKSEVCVLVPSAIQCDVCSNIGTVVINNPPPMGNGSQHWRARSRNLEVEGEGPDWVFGQNEKSPEWRHPLRPENARRAAEIMRDRDEVRFVRDHAADGTRCLLCSTPPLYLFHTIKECPCIRGLCYRCLATGHVASNCPIKATAQRPKYKSCYYCFFQFESIGDTEVHRGNVNLTPCNDTSGERLRMLVWQAYRDVRHLRALRRDFIGMPLSDIDFEPWLTEKENGRMLNNFVRVAAAVLRINGWC